MPKKSIFLVFFILTFFSSVMAQELSAPNFALKDLNNNAVTLSSFRGKQAVILFFWTTWCPYCRIEINK